MPPCVDVYVWVPQRPSDLLREFIDRYVDVSEPGDDRLASFIRTYIEAAPIPGDAQAIGELRRDPAAPGDAFSLYLRAHDYESASITITCEGAAVLGLSLDDPLNSPRTVELARSVLDELRNEFQSPAAIAGAELAPPQSREEWDAEPTIIRIGALPSR